MIAVASFLETGSSETSTGLADKRTFFGTHCASTESIWIAFDYLMAEAERRFAFIPFDCFIYPLAVLVPCVSAKCQVEVQVVA